jgi:hypothetical protein
MVKNLVKRLGKGTGSFVCRDELIAFPGPLKIPVNRMFLEICSIWGLLHRFDALFVFPSSYCVILPEVLLPCAI